MKPNNPSVRVGSPRLSKFVTTSDLSTHEGIHGRQSLFAIDADSTKNLISIWSRYGFEVEDDWIDVEVFDQGVDQTGHNIGLRSCRQLKFR